ncbi:hypothetical protein JCM14036_22160 [Desulfotomaculum defluvii]
MEEKLGKVNIVVTEDVPLIIKSSSSRTQYDVVELATGGYIEIHLPCTLKIGQLIGDESNSGAAYSNPWGRDIIITGERGKNGARGRDGESGGAGTAGERGGDGGDAPDVTIEIGELKRNLNILNVGGSGGDGGKGGDGGNGRDGSGSAGGKGGDGGNGGNSGNGGNGGKVVIKCPKINDHTITPECKKAPCGNAGAGGRGGAGGSGIPPGDGGKSGGNGAIGLSGELGTIDINP